MEPRPLPTSERRRRAALRVSAAGIGFALGLGSLSLLWPRADRTLEPPALASAADLAKAPTRAVTVLVIGVDAEHVRDASNGAAPAGPANSDAVLLLRVQPAGVVQVLPLPIEAAVQLPGQQRPQPLGSLYRQGGVALVADAVRELAGLPAGQPDRYVVLGRSDLRTLIEAMGRIDVSPTQAMRYSDRSQKLRIDLQAGLQRLDGVQVEHMVRFRDGATGEDGRRQQHVQLLRSLLRELAQPARLPLLAPLARQLLGGVGTNLSEGEVLSLLAAGLSQGSELEVVSLPLLPPAPGAGRQGLRQLAPRNGPLAGWGDNP
jgi:LCP family protein required for cell wall assembly